MSTELPDGDYVPEVLAIHNRVDEKQGKLVEWDLRFTLPNNGHAVVDKTKTNHLKSEKAVDYLRKELARVGLNVEDGADLEAKRQQLVGKKVRMSVVTNEDGFQCFYVKGLAEPCEAAQEVKW